MAETRKAPQADHHAEREEPQLVASDLDELTHEEVLWLYRDAEENIRFAKLLQWRMTAGAIAVFLIISLMMPTYGAGGLGGVLTIIACLVAATVLCILVILQSWQGTERARVRFIHGKLSSLARDVYNLKPSLNADIERFILLGFMFCGVLTAVFLTLGRLLRWFF